MSFSDPQAVHNTLEDVEIITFAVAPLGCNCSIVFSRSTGEAVVVDPGGEAPRIIGHLESHGCRVNWIVHTHAHFDHCLGTHAVASHCSNAHGSADADGQPVSGVRVALHSGDQELYDKLEMQCRMFGVPQQKAERAIDHLLQDEECITFGPNRMTVLHTPGHTPGSCCFAVNEKPIVFSGDTLFAMGIGRTDLWGGDSGAIMKSIRERLFTLDDGTYVIPGHGPFTRIFEEKQSNPFF
ncbi:MAG: MBL fold metallo-hydrolase [Leptospiraceae bacterium]|nr:MBL fold metallo-hydrolase [Leptospiraceae bacterium]